MREPERLPTRRASLTINSATPGPTFRGPLPDRVSAEDARAMVWDWSGDDPGPAGANFNWFGGRWGSREALWRLGADGWFYKEIDQIHKTRRSNHA